MHGQQVGEQLQLGQQLYGTQAGPAAQHLVQLKAFPALQCCKAGQIGMRWLDNDAGAVAS